MSEYKARIVESTKRIVDSMYKELNLLRSAQIEDKGNFIEDLTFSVICSIAKRTVSANLGQYAFDTKNYDREDLRDFALMGIISLFFGAKEAVKEQVQRDIDDGIYNEDRIKDIVEYLKKKMDEQNANQNG